MGCLSALTSVLESGRVGGRQPLETTDGAVVGPEHSDSSPMVVMAPHAAPRACVSTCACDPPPAPPRPARLASSLTIRCMSCGADGTAAARTAADESAADRSAIDVLDAASAPLAPPPLVAPSSLPLPQAFSCSIGSAAPVGLEAARDAATRAAESRDPAPEELRLVEGANG